MADVRAPAVSAGYQREGAWGKQLGLERVPRAGTDKVELEGLDEGGTYLGG